MTESIKLKYLCRSFTTSLSVGDLSDSGFPVYGAGGIMGFNAIPIMNKPYLGIVKDGAGAGRIKKYPANSSLIGTMAYIIPDSDVDIDWLMYCIQTLDLLKDVNIATIPHIYFSVYGNMKLPHIALDKQIDIASTLNHTLKKIDESIHKHQLAINKISEYKKGIISSCLNIGINYAFLQETNNRYFPNIPINWQMTKLKYIFTINKRIAGEEGHTVLSITQRGIIPKDLSKNEGQIAQSYANYQIVHEGDFAMNHMDLLTGWVDISQYEGVTSPDYRVFTLNDTENNNPKYFLYIMQMCYFNRIFYNMGAGVSELGRWRLQATPFREFKVPVPPIDEQNEIVKFLDEKCTKADEAIKRQEMAIEKLEEYRKSIIYHAVTGKIDCRKEKMK